MKVTCITCGKLLDKGSYCEEHKRKRYVSATTPESIARRKRPERVDTRRNRGQQYGPQYRSARKRYLQWWLSSYGPVCPGYGRAPHAVERMSLTIDHVVPIAHGGGHDWDNLSVLCLSCNSRKKDKLGP